MAADSKGQRILILEDEILVAMYLEDLLADLGHQVVQIAGRVDAALAAASDSDLDFAILDINVAGTKSFPVADILRARGIPFAFATGYGAEGIPDSYRHEAVLQKPYLEAQLRQTLERALPGAEDG